MRTLMAVLIGIVLFPAAISNPERNRLPTLLADVVTLSEVRRASEIGVISELGASRDTLLAERPIDAREGTISSVFVVAEDGAVLRRVPIAYGRATQSQIEIVSGVSPGDRIVVSDMRAWDGFDRVRLGSR